MKEDEIFSESYKPWKEKHAEEWWEMPNRIYTRNTEEIEEIILKNLSDICGMDVMDFNCERIQRFIYNGPAFHEEYTLDDVKVLDVRMNFETMKLEVRR